MLSKELIYWFIRIPVIVIVMILIIIIVGSMAKQNVDVENVKSYVLRNKIILDEDCLAYKDYRVHQGIIDKDKFNKINIQNCLNTKTGIILTLGYKEESESILINEDLADKIDFCVYEKTFLCERKKYDLILKEGSKNIPCNLTIDTINLK